MRPCSDLNHSDLGRQIFLMTYKFEISLRSDEANELHGHIQRLVANGIIQLVLVRIRPTGL